MIIENLLCENCSSRPAKLVVLRQRRDDTVRLFVCSECASERARLYTDAKFDLQRVLDQFEGKPSGGDSAQFGCKMCGMTLAEFLVDVRPGCCLCYARFAGQIQQAIDSVQIHTHHVGKAPAQ